jgi:hypothetical protein
MGATTHFAASEPYTGQEANWNDLQPSGQRSVDRPDVVGDARYAAPSTYLISPEHGAWTLFTIKCFHCQILLRRSGPLSDRFACGHGRIPPAVGWLFGARPKRCHLPFCAVFLLRAGEVTRALQFTVCNNQAAPAVRGTLQKKYFRCPVRAHNPRLFVQMRSEISTKPSGLSWCSAGGVIHRVRGGSDLVGCVPPA